MGCRRRRRRRAVIAGAAVAHHYNNKQEEQAAQVLAAHQALTKANVENASRFRDVIEFLEQELRFSPAASGARPSTLL